jgi:hypothetical protein
VHDALAFVETNAAGSLHHAKLPSISLIKQIIRSQRPGRISTFTYNAPLSLTVSAKAELEPNVVRGAILLLELAADVTPLWILVLVGPNYV